MSDGRLSSGQAGPEALLDGGRGEHRYHLEVHEVGPLGHPLLEQATISGLHYLIAPREIVGNPARDVAEAVGHEAALCPEAPIDRDRVPIAEMLDDEEVH